MKQTSLHEQTNWARLSTRKTKKTFKKTEQFPPKERFSTELITNGGINIKQYL